jgi:hypothetical protein
LQSLIPIAACGVFLGLSAITVTTLRAEGLTLGFVGRCALAWRRGRLVDCSCMEDRGPCHRECLAAMRGNILDRSCRFDEPSELAKGIGLLPGWLNCDLYMGSESPLRLSKQLPEKTAILCR